MKPKNILLTKNHQVKVTGFGLWRNINLTPGDETMVVGNFNYIAPEIFQNQRYSFSTDIWGIGCIVYELMMKKAAFPETSIFQLMKNIVENEPEEISKYYSPLLISSVKLMMHKDPLLRFTIEQIKNAFFPSCLLSSSNYIYQNNPLHEEIEQIQTKSLQVQQENEQLTTHNNQLHEEIKQI